MEKSFSENVIYCGCGGWETLHLIFSTPTSRRKWIVSRFLMTWVLLLCKSGKICGLGKTLAYLVKYLAKKSHVR